MMNNLTKITVNTGGGCMVDYYKTDTDGKVKCIGVTDECIVGYAESEPWMAEEPTEVWVIHLD